MVANAILMEPRIEHRGEVNIIAFATNNPDLPTVLVVLDEARQVRDVIAVQKGGAQPGNEVSVSSAASGLTAVSLLTGVTKEVVTTCPCSRFYGGPRSGTSTNMAILATR